MAAPGPAAPGSLQQQQQQPWRVLCWVAGAAGALCAAGAALRGKRFIADASPGSDAAGGGGPTAPLPPSQERALAAPAAPALPNRSVCWELPGFRAMQPSPMRSPLLLADALMPAVRGKRYCEVGTRDGDHLWCLSRSGAASVQGFEFVRHHCDAALGRGLPLLCGNFLHTTAKELAGCEVYFWWPEMQSQTRCFLAHIYSIGAHSRPPRIFVAIDNQWTDDVGQFTRDIGNWSGRVVANVSFNERADSRVQMEATVPRGSDMFDMFLRRQVGYFYLVEYALDPALREMALQTARSASCREFAAASVIDFRAPSGRRRTARRRR